MKNTQPTSHPLKWVELVKQVRFYFGENGNPDIWIEDIRRCGPCVGVEPEIVCKDEDTDGIEASFSVIHDKGKNRITIRHHF